MHTYGSIWPMNSVSLENFAETSCIFKVPKRTSGPLNLIVGSDVWKILLQIEVLGYSMLELLLLDGYSIKKVGKELI